MIFPGAPGNVNTNNKEKKSTARKKISLTIDGIYYFSSIMLIIKLYYPLKLFEFT